MPIIELQRRLAEVGRIRLGRQVESRSGKKHPAALDTFRLTSRDRPRIEEAAKLYGGTVTKWDSPSGIPEWEVITQADRLPVIVPPSAMAFSQNYELWSGGGCHRRCDGVREQISEQPCLCDPENRQCEIHTRLSVMLRDCKWGVWRVDTTGYYAAIEIGGSVEVIKLAVGLGHMLPATLRLDQRTIKRPEEGTKRFVVPVLDPDGTPGQLLTGTIGAAEPAAPPALTPVPDSGARPASIADQVAASQNIPSRRRATPIPATGIAPRTAAQAGGVSTTGHPPPDDDERRYEDQMDRAREAQEQAAATQDPPRMVTHSQLTKLGILLAGRGYTNRTDDGKTVMLGFCMNLVRTLMPENPWRNRTITTRKQLTFDEAHTLINHLETEERSQPPSTADEAESNDDPQQPQQDPQDDPQRDEPDWVTAAADADTGDDTGRPAAENGQTDLLENQLS
jgi:hypothetical protein